MTAKTSFMLSVLLLGSPVGRVAGDQAAPVSAAESFNDAGAMDGWSFSNGPEWPGARGALERRPGGGRTNDGVLVLRYDFEQGGHYVAARVQLPGERKIDAVRLWINKPSSNVMIFRGEDSQGESFQKNLRFDYRGWQQLEIALGGWEFHWGGDGVFQGPPRQFDILIENDGGNRSGELLIDDVQWVYQPPSQPAPEQRTPAQGPDGTTHSATYLESDFGPADNWSYAGSTAGGFESNHWTYDFAAGSDRCALNRGRSILGRPTALRLTVISDGSGNELTALFGSHFQLFDRSLGILDTLGPKTFEVPMGDMSTWHHFGGEDDGLVRYPLRLENLGLAKKTDQTSGVLRLIRLEFVTEFDRRQTVAVVPSVASREGDGLRFTVVLRSLHDAPLQGKLHYSLRSLDRSAETGSVDLVVPPGGPSVTHQFETSYGDHTMIEGRFQFVAGRVSSRKVSTTIARRTAGPIDTTLVPDSRIGVGMYLYRFHGHPQADRWMQRMCELAAAAGVKWTREEFHWNWVEPIKGQRDFTFFDRLVETANANGISVYGLVCYWTDWSKPPFTDQFIEDYCDYLRALVGRYRGRIKHWEIWNEPNVFFWPGPKEMYAKLLARAYQTIKEVDPTAQVLGCSTAGIDTAFIKMVLKHQAPFDALTVHPYRHALDPAGFMRELRETRDLVGGREVWITEMGWPSNIGGLTERQQAGYVARTYISALASGAARSVAWYDFREDGTDPYYNEHHFGLVRNDLTPKIGYRALAAVGQLLGRSQFKGELSLGDDLVGFVFEDGDRQTAALWSPEVTRLVRFEIEPADAVVLNVINEPAAAARSGSSVALRLMADLPVYVRSDGPLTIKRRPAPAVIETDRPGVHPGEAFTIRVRAEADVKSGRPVPPAGWTVSGSETDQALTVTPPTWALPGDYTVSVPIEYAGQTIDLPVAVRIVPALVRG